MNRTELVTAMAEKTGLTKKDAEAALKAFIETVSGEIKAGGKVQLIGFGNFETAHRNARTSRNPQTGEKTQKPACEVPKFKPAKALKELVNS